MTTPIVTRQQQFLTRALDDVNSVEAKRDPETAKIYGGLCHKIPVLVRTCGLCQALASIESKKGENSKPQEKAYTQLHGHIAGLLGTSPKELIGTVRTAPVTEYIRLTRMLLSGWVYYKRFAVSILKVEASDASGDEK